MNFAKAQVSQEEKARKVVRTKILQLIANIEDNVPFNFMYTTSVVSFAFLQALPQFGKMEEIVARWKVPQHDAIDERAIPELRALLTEL